MRRRRSRFWSRAKSLGFLVLVSVPTVVYLAYRQDGTFSWPRSWPLSGPAPTVARLLRVVDGDTLRIRIPGYEETRFRLSSVDAPERDQPFGDAATDCLDDVLSAGTITASVQKRDRYGRLVGNLFVDGQRVDVQLVTLGCAWWYSRYAPASLSLALAQQKAKSSAIGLWANAQPVKPEDWRRR